MAGIPGIITAPDGSTVQPAAQPPSDNESRHSAQTDAKAQSHSVASSPDAFTNSNSDSSSDFGRFLQGIWDAAAGDDITTLADPKASVLNKIGAGIDLGSNFIDPLKGAAETGAKVALKAGAKEAEHFIGDAVAKQGTKDAEHLIGDAVAKQGTKEVARGVAAQGSVARIASPDISAADLTGKSKADIEQLAKDRGLIQDTNKPNRYRDPATGKERLRIDPGHIDKTTGLPYNNVNAAKPHVHGYDASGAKIRDPQTNDPHFPLNSAE